MTNHSSSTIAMTINKTIFGVRTDSDENLQPTPEELAAFLENSNKDGGAEARIDALTTYRQLLKEADDLERRQASDEVAPDIRRRILFGVLAHTQFLNSV